MWLAASGGPRGKGWCGQSDRWRWLAGSRIVCVLKFLENISRWTIENAGAVIRSGCNDWMDESFSSGVRQIGAMLFDWRKAVLMILRHIGASDIPQWGIYWCNLCRWTKRDISSACVYYRSYLTTNMFKKIEGTGRAKMLTYFQVYDSCLRQSDNSKKQISQFFVDIHNNADT